MAHREHYICLEDFQDRVMGNSNAKEWKAKGEENQQMQR